MEDKILNGMATILWGTAWADHVEEHGCQRLSGCKIEEVMPPIPRAARDLAQRLAGKIEGANGCEIVVLFARALAADGKSWETHGEDLAERFGECMAYEAMGAGVSWSDDHEEFAHESAHVETGELMSLADRTCTTPKRYRLQAREEGETKYQTIERSNSIEDLKWGWQQFLTPVFRGKVRIVEGRGEARRVIMTATPKD